MAVALLALPLHTLVDEDIKIELTGLKPKQNITLTSSLVDERGLIIECFAYYRSDEDGTVKLSRNASFGGMYVGVESMGLFWAMEGSKRNKNKYVRLIKRDVSKPMVVEISAYDKWVNIEDIEKMEPLATTQINRWFKKKGVQRQIVKQGSIRGTLFIPEGCGPFPAVIDMFGGAGGLFEYRASMLASRGFLALALAIYDYDDLPKDVNNGLNLEYFEDAVEFLKSQPECRGMGVGVVGVSLGGSIANAMGAYLPAVRAVVCINADQFSNGVLFSYKLHKSPETKFDMTKLMTHGDVNALQLGTARVYEKTADQLPKGQFDCYKSDCNYLLLASGDDGAYQMDVVANDFTKLRNKFKINEDRWKLKYYPGAGHLLELPNTPLCSIIYLKIAQQYFYYGGKKVEHANAQSDSWKEILRFLFAKLTIKSNL